MRKLIVCPVAAAVALALSPVSADELVEKAQETFKPIPSVVPAVKGNPITHEKIELGKMLFFDPRLSASQISSSSTCHNVGTGVAICARPKSMMAKHRE
jgi:cytochrome c peroxidase